MIASCTTALEISGRGRHRHIGGGLRDEDEIVEQIPRRDGILFRVELLEQLFVWFRRLAGSSKLREKSASCDLPVVAIDCDDRGVALDRASATGSSRTSPNSMSDRVIPGCDM